MSSVGPTPAGMKSPRHAGTLAYLLSDSALFKDNADRASQLRLKGEVGVSLSSFLWDSTKLLRSQALNSKFITGIKFGNMDPTYFGAYMVQDSVYVYRSMQSIDTAAKKATDPKLKQFLHEKSEAYKKYYQDMFKTWNIKDANGIELSEACAKYAAYEQHVAEKMSEIYLVVALIPCARLWPWLGEEISKSKEPNFGVYDSWAKKNLDPTSQGYRILEDIIDNAYIAGKLNKDEALTVYNTCMTGEANFFNFNK